MQRENAVSEGKSKLPYYDEILPPRSDVPAGLRASPSVRCLAPLDAGLVTDQVPSVNGGWCFAA